MGIWTVWRAREYPGTVGRIEDVDECSSPEEAVCFYLNGRVDSSFGVCVYEEGKEFCVISPDGEKHVVIAHQPMCSLRPAYHYELEELLDDEGFKNRGEDGEIDDD